MKKKGTFDEAIEELRWARHKDDGRTPAEDKQYRREVLAAIAVLKACDKATFGYVKGLADVCKGRR